MTDRFVINREVNCTKADQKVRQELSYIKIQTLGSLITQNKLIKAFCSGYPTCDAQDCQIMIGKMGKVYSEIIVEPVDVASN